MERETVNIIRGINRKIEEFNERISDFESNIKIDKMSAKINVPLFFDHILAPVTNGNLDIGTSNNFIKDLYIDGKIIYPDKLDFGINNDFVINKIGKIGFHKKDNLNAFSIKNIPTFQVKNVQYIGDNSLFFKIDDNLSEYISKFDIIRIKSDFFQVVEIEDKIVKIKNLSKSEEGSVLDEEDKEYDLTIYPSLLGIYTHEDNPIFHMDGLGDLFYKTDERVGNINIKGSVNIDGEISVDKIFSDNIELRKKELIPNLNAEYLNGKVGPTDGEIVGTKDKQILWNKSIGDILIMKNNRIMELGDPIFDKDAVTKRYVDGYLTGLQVKIPVKCCSTGNLECSYNHEDGLLISRIVGKINNEDFLHLFDHYSLLKNESVLVINQKDERENGIYYVNNAGSENDFFILERRSDFNQNNSNDKLKGYYVFCENGTHYGNYGYVFSLLENFKWNSSPIKFHPFSKIEQINFGKGFRKIKNSVNLEIDERNLILDNNKLGLKQHSIDNDYLRNSVIYFQNSEGVDFSKSTVGLGETIHCNLKVDQSQFVFGKNGELKLAKSALTDFNKSMFHEDSGKNALVTNSFQNVFQIFPPNSFNVKLQVSEDFYEKEKDCVVQYFITAINDEGKETNYISSDIYYISKDIESIYASISWEAVKNSSGYNLYRMVDEELFYTFLRRNETEIVDILSPINFSKINWKKTEKELPSKNETVITINKISSLGDSYINSGNIGFGTCKPMGTLHINNHSDDSSLVIEGRKLNGKIPLVLLKSNGDEQSIPNIKSYHGKERSNLLMGKNIRLEVENEEGIISFGRDQFSDDNKNEEMGTNIFSTQVMDGGLYVDGTTIIKKGRSYGTMHNKIGNHAAILKTGCQYDSVGNEVSFMWEDDKLMAIPFQDGNQISRKKINVKNFVIDHPVDKEKYLIHGCLEGPTADVFYRGKGRLLEGDFETVVKLPDYFNALVDSESVTILLTPIDRVENICANISRINENIFIVKRKKIEKRLEFFWEVKATRKNEEFPVEPNKTDVNVKNIGPYSFLN